MIPKYNIQKIKSKLNSNTNWSDYVPPQLSIAQQEIDWDLYNPEVLAAFEDMANVYGLVLGDDIVDLYDMDIYLNVNKGLESEPDGSYVSSYLRVHTLHTLPIFPDDPFYPSVDKNQIEPVDLNTVRYWSSLGSDSAFSKLYVDSPIGYHVEDGKAYRLNSLDDIGGRNDVDMSEWIPYTDIIDTYRKTYYQDASGLWWQALMDFEVVDGYPVGYIEGWISSAPPSNPRLMNDFTRSGPAFVVRSYAVSPQFIKSNNGDVYRVERYRFVSNTNITEYMNIKSATLVTGFNDGPIRQEFDSWGVSAYKTTLPVPGSAKLINKTPVYLMTVERDDKDGDFGSVTVTLPKPKNFVARLKRIIEYYGGKDVAGDYLSLKFEGLRDYFRIDDNFYEQLKPETKKLLGAMSQAQSQYTQPPLFQMQTDPTEHYVSFLIEEFLRVKTNFKLVSHEDKSYGSEARFIKKQLTANQWLRGKSFRSETINISFEYPKAGSKMRIFISYNDGDAAKAVYTPIGHSPSDVIARLLGLKVQTIVSDDLKP